MRMAVVLAFLMSSFILVQACPTGFFRQNDTCKKCRPSCDGGRIVKTKCTSTSDMTCICQPGKFWETALVYCKLCKKCDKGEIITNNCTPYQNRECVQCNEGTYAKSQFKCAPCSRCKEGEVVKKKCSLSQNTICESYIRHLTDAPLTEFGPSGADIPKRNSSITARIVSKTNLGYIWVIIALVFLLLVFAICCLVQTYRIKQISTRSQKSTSSCSVDSEQETFINKKSVQAVTHDPGILVRHLNPEVIISLSRLLNPPGLKNWTKVAASLGFKQIDIRNFEIHKDQCFQDMIEAWGTSRDATVYKLYQVFITMDRDDCAQILEDVLRTDEMQVV